MYAFFNPLFRQILQTKLYLETAENPPNDHIADWKQIVSILGLRPLLGSMLEVGSNKARNVGLTRALLHLHAIS